MSWETHRGGRYYYAVTRQGGRLVKRYLGRGPLAELAAGIDAEARAGRAADTERLRAERARFDGADRALRALDEACALLMTAELIVAGYHKHNDSEWRRRRERGTGRA